MRERNPFRKFAVPCIAVLALLVVLSTPAFAQLAGSATITGALTDLFQKSVQTSYLSQ